MLDVAHVVAATALLGAIIHHFDDRGESGSDYLIGIDRAAHAAAIEVFSEFNDGPRLFDDQFVRETLRNPYTGQLYDGVEYLSTWLLSALGWDDMPAEDQR